MRLDGSFPVCIWDLFCRRVLHRHFSNRLEQCLQGERDVLKISVRMGAILLWSSLRMRGEILSGPAAFLSVNMPWNHGGIPWNTAMEY